jgi:hypothetical protein
MGRDAEDDYSPRAMKQGDAAHSASGSRGSGWLTGVFAIDPRGLAALRIGVGLTLLVDYSARTDHFVALYTDAGAFPLRLLDPWMRETVVPLHLLSGSYAWQALLFVLGVGAATAMVVGWRSRLATLISWGLLVSLHVRNPIVLNFGDTILRVALFWAIFLPLGSCWSLDANRRGPEVPSAQPLHSIAGAAYLLQICFVYVFTALLKSGADWHETGLALYYALHIDYWATPLGVWLRDFVPFTILMSRATLALELLGPLLLLAPVWWVRSAAAVSFMALHLGIAASLELGIFPWVDVVILLPFLPTRIWDEVERRLFRVRSSAAAPADAAADGEERCVVGSRSPMHRVGSAALGAILVYVLAHNVQGMWPALAVPDSLTSAGQWLSINQEWRMFTPNTPRRDGWFVLRGHLADGTTVDLISPDATPGFDKPENVAARHASYRWAAFLFQMRDSKTNEPLRRNWARWQCRDWNRRATSERRLGRVEMWFVLETTPPPGLQPKPKRQILLDFDCAAPRASAL